MIGIYDYTVILTYLSVVSGISGILLAINGHPFFAVVCLMLSGLLDMFDGKVARLKKRSKKEVSFGIQLDSLADIICFGVLPIVIGYACGLTQWYVAPIFFIFVLGALIRLAHFNVNEEEVVKTKSHSTVLTGLPTTAVALILPLIYSLKAFTGEYFAYIYGASLLIIGFLFVLNKQFITKPNNTKMLLFIIVGILELLLIVAGFKLWLAN